LFAEVIAHFEPQHAEQTRVKRGQLSK
jgi:hypothetical protein